MTPVVAGLAMGVLVVSGLRSQVGVLAGVSGLVVGGLLAVPAGSSAVEGFAFERVAGPDRFATSALVADRVEEGTTAILANGERDRFADALAATYLAGELDAPILLTREGSIPQVVRDQIEDSGVTSVKVVGGFGVIADEQADELRLAGIDVDRIAGSNRYETNAKVIDEVGAAPEDLALIATGETFPDALAAGPLAERGHPLGLASRNGVPTPVLEALTEAGVERALVIGGESAVGEGAVSDLESAGIEVVDRLAGDGRADTSVAVAEYSIANLGLTDTAVNLASGAQAGGGADALSGGVLTGQQNRPLLVTQSTSNPSDAVRGFIAEHAEILTEGLVFGGESAIDADSEAELTSLAQGGEVEPDPDPGTPSAPSRVPTSIELTAPEADSVHLLGAEVPVSATVLDQRGRAMRGLDVDFTATEAGDPAGDATATTGTDGVASTDLEVTEVGDVVVTATTKTRRGRAPLSDSVDVEVSSGLAQLTMTLADGTQTTQTFGTLQEAIDATVGAPADATKRIVATGNFEEDVTLPEPLTELVGSDDGGARLAAAGDDGACLAATDVDGACLVGTITMDADDQSVSGLYLETSDPAIRVVGARADISDNTFLGNEVAVLLEDDTAAITDNTFTATAEDQVFVDAEAAPGADLTAIETASGNDFGPAGTVRRGNTIIPRYDSVATEITIVNPLGRGRFVLPDESVEVGAIVLNQYGEPMAGVDVELLVEGDPMPLDSGTTTQNGSVSLTPPDVDPTAEVTYVVQVVDDPTVATSVDIAYVEGVATLTAPDSDVMPQYFATIGEAAAAAEALPEGNPAVITLEGEFTESEVEITTDDTVLTGNVLLTGSLVWTGDRGEVEDVEINPGQGDTVGVDASGDEMTLDGVEIDEFETAVRLAGEDAVVDSGSLNDNDTAIDVDAPGLVVTGTFFTGEVDADVFVDATDAPTTDLEDFLADAAANSFSPGARIDGTRIIAADSPYAQTVEITSPDPAVQDPRFVGGRQLTVTAEVTDQYGDPLPRQPVELQEYDGQAPLGEPRRATTDDTGSVSFMVDTPSTGTRRYVVSDGIGGPQDEVTVTFSEGVARLRGLTADSQPVRRDFASIGAAVAAANGLFAGAEIFLDGEFTEDVLLPASLQSVRLRQADTSPAYPDINGTVDIACELCALQEVDVFVPGGGSAVEVTGDLARLFQVRIAGGGLGLDVTGSRFRGELVEVDQAARGVRLAGEEARFTSSEVDVNTIGRGSAEGITIEADDARLDKVAVYFTTVGIDIAPGLTGLEVTGAGSSILTGAGTAIVARSPIAVTGTDFTHTGNNPGVITWIDATGTSMDLVAVQDPTSGNSFSRSGASAPTEVDNQKLITR